MKIILCPPTKKSRIEIKYYETMCFTVLYKGVSPDATKKYIQVPIIVFFFNFKIEKLTHFGRFLTGFYLLMNILLAIVIGIHK